MKDAACHLCEEMMDKRDDLIRLAINRQIGTDWVLADIPERGLFRYEPDGSEVFSFDGVDLIQFFPMQSETVTDGASIKLVASRKYRELYPRREPR